MPSPQDPRPATPGADGPLAIGPSRVPADLEPGERALAGWFSHLERPAASAGLEDRVLAALPSSEPAPERPESDDVRRLWGWSTAAAAALLIAIGLVALMGGSDADTGPAVLPERTATAPSKLWVMDDPNLALYHDLETFDSLGAQPGDVLALGHK